jgi:hypothetical protein
MMQRQGFRFDMVWAIEFVACLQHAPVSGIIGRVFDSLKL